MMTADSSGLSWDVDNQHVYIFPRRQFLYLNV